jgi:hypothetical protein
MFPTLHSLDPVSATWPEKQETESEILWARKVRAYMMFEWSIGFGLGKFRRHDEKAD